MCSHALLLNGVIKSPITDIYLTEVVVTVFILNSMKCNFHDVIINVSDVEDTVFWHIS